MAGVEELRVRRLSAGGDWIRTSSPTVVFELAGQAKRPSRSAARSLSVLEGGPAVRIPFAPAESLRTLSSSTPATHFRWSPTRKRTDSLAAVRRVSIQRIKRYRRKSPGCRGRHSVTLAAAISVMTLDGGRVTATFLPHPFSLSIWSGTGVGYWTVRLRSEWSQRGLVADGHPLADL